LLPKGQKSRCKISIWRQDWRATQPADRRRIENGVTHEFDTGNEDNNEYIIHNYGNITTFHTIDADTYHILAIDQRGHVSKVSANGTDWKEMSSTP